MAIFLAQDHEFEVDVFEAFEEERISGPTVRSWNVVLSKRGLEALKAAGVDLLQEVGFIPAVFGSHDMLVNIHKLPVHFARLKFFRSRHRRCK